MSEIRVGSTVGKYQIIELLGRGGMAEVYKGYQENLERYVAIKVMHAFLASDADFLGRFRREARAMAALNHPNIVGVYDFDVVGDSYYIVMEFVGQGALKERLDSLGSQNQRMPMGEAVRIVLEIADALAYAHSRGMYHRDIKPGNILLSETGKAILVDFGIAKMMSGPSHTATGSMIGTPAYMSPEQGLGQPGDHRSDIYSLGVLFFQMVTGQLPFNAETPLAVVMKHVSEAVPQPSTVEPNVPASIQTIIMRAMSKDPEERYQSATEMANELRRALTQLDDSGVLGAVPSRLLQEQRTPPPVTDISDDSIPPVSGERAAATMVAAGQGAAGSTRVARPAERTEVVSGPPRPPAPAAPAAAASGGGRGLRIGLIVVGLFVVLAVIATAAAFAFLPRDGDTPLVVEVTVPPGTPADTATPQPTAAQINAATINAQFTLTAAAMPTATPSATPTPSSTPTATPAASATPNLTATVLAGCTFSMEFVQHFTYSNRTFRGASLGTTSFPLNFVLENNGTCAVPAGSVLSFVEGEDFGTESPLEVEGAATGEELVITLDAASPASAGTYAGTWQLEGPALAPYSVTFDVSVPIFVPATATPQATATPAVTATPTPVVGSDPIGAIITFQSCEYVGGGSLDYRCSGRAQIYGGGGGEYNVYIDTGPAQQGRTAGGIFLFQVQARRCFSWQHTMFVQDDFGSPELQQPLLFFPDQQGSLFPTGACTEN